MEKRTTLLLIILFVVSAAYSQTVSPTVFSSNGGYSPTSQGSIAWTIGEPVSETYTSSANINTMGFHQPEEIGLATLIKEEDGDKSIFIYPNPVRDHVAVNFNNIESGDYQLELVDGLGKVVLSAAVTVSERSKLAVLSLSELSSGNYYLKIIGDALHKTIKINKIQ